MKTKTVVLIVLLITVGALARMSGSFISWGRLEGISPYIIVARCGAPTLPTPGEIIADAPASDSSIEVLWSLKGTNTLGSARLLTDYKLRQGENYLLFGFFNGGMYEPFEEFRVVPLGRQFSTDSIAGKKIDEQLQILFRQSVDNLNREIQKDEEEKQRIESGIVK